MRISVIINPVSGRRPARNMAGLEHLVAATGVELTLVTYDSSERIETLVSRMVDGTDMIGVAGGDGTLNGAVNGVMMSDRPEIPILFLPAGRGCDTPRTLSSFSAKRLIRRSFGFRTRKVDLGLLTGNDEKRRYFINESSIGLGAFAARSANKLPRRIGSAAYFLGAIDGVIRSRSYRIRMEIDAIGTVELPRCHHVTIANGRYFGAGLHIAPGANAQDGMLDIIAVADARAFEIALALPKLFRSTHLDHPKVHHWKSKAVTIDASPNPLVETDGEQWASVAARYSVVPGALTWAEPL